MAKFFKLCYLQNLEFNNRLPSSILFQHHNNIKFLSESFKLAKWLLCVNKFKIKYKINYSPCDLCESCILYSKKNHPDFYYINVKNNTKQIIVNKISRIKNFLNSKPTKSKSKLIIIAPGELIKSKLMDFFNKSLKNPPEFIYYLLYANKDSLPTNIIDRCLVCYYQKILSTNIFSNLTIIKHVIINLNHLVFYYNANIFFMTNILEKMINDRLCMKHILYILLNLALKLYVSILSFSGFSKITLFCVFINKESLVYIIKFINKIIHTFALIEKNKYVNNSLLLESLFKTWKIF